MIAELNAVSATIRGSVYALFRQMVALESPFILRSDLIQVFEQTVSVEQGQPLCGTVIERMIHRAQEAAIDASWVYLGLRPRTGHWMYVRVHTESLIFEAVSASEYLEFKERIVNGRPEDNAWPFEINFDPFSRHTPRLREVHSIGRGGEFLNRRLAGQLFSDEGPGLDRLFSFLSLHTCQGQQLMVNDSISGVEDLRVAARSALEALADAPPEAEWNEVAEILRALGFEPGWGRTVLRIRDTLKLLQNLLEAPDPSTFEALLARIPMMFRVAIFSPHGYFGQSGVMGLPDTGGQVVYILDQVRALETEMRRRLHEQGLDFEPEIAVVTRLIPENRGTTSDQAVEAIAGTHNARILRVPFRTSSGEIVPHWISRFSVWPFLERFALEAEKEILATLDGRPDLIIGNYSDGNLVATLLAQRLQVTHCTIAHALEKSKYLFSGLYWQHNEENYHFSCQFLADLVAMNAADFIITSTFQEIAGDGKGIGQYESYSTFTMPQLMRVTRGIDVFDPRFNIVSPGVDEETYFAYTEKDRRLHAVVPEIENLLFGREVADTRGDLADSERPILLSMARMDRVKNLTGLVQCFGESPQLRESANLVIVGGIIDPDSTSDAEERHEVLRMHQLFDELELNGSVRWIGQLLNKPLAGELYRYVADRRGVFIQPALFEAFGLTVIEAMASGLPTFATVYGGPSEIIENGISGFHIDPNQQEHLAELVAGFLDRARADENSWIAVSRAGLERVQSRYTWRLYAERLMTLARVYGFWKYVTRLERAETNAYLQALYNLQFRPMAHAMEE